jgi:4-amino-4-deoxy-L-arabinose transferase-like glycosyltransferase
MSARLSAHRRVDRVTRWLLVAALLGLAVRVVYVTAAQRGPCTFQYHGYVGVYHSACTGSAGHTNDQVFYNAAADSLALGHGFNGQLPGRSGEAEADHPPLTVIVLAGVSFAFDHPPLQWVADRSVLAPHVVEQTNVREQRYFLALLGAVVVFLIGLLARSIAGDRAAIIAAFVAALYPNLWVNDGLIFSETVTNLVVVLTLILAVRAWRRPSTTRLVLLGAACGLVALGRAELLLLAPLLIAPIAWSARGGGTAVVVRGLAVGLLATALVIAPWVAFNNVRFRDRTFLSTNDGLALAGANCHKAYYGDGIGLWYLVPPCSFTDAQIAALGPVDAAGHRRAPDESEVSTAYRTRAVDYMRAHWKRVPLVVAARIGRTWSLFQPIEMITYNEGESRVRPVSWAGLVTYYPLAIAAIAGAVILWRRRLRRALWVLVTPAIAVTVAVAVTYGQVRFRAAAEPSIVVLAAIAGVELWARFDQGHTTAAPGADPAATRTA